MTSTGSVEQITPSTYLLTIVATVIAATKCKLVGGSRRRPQRSFAARPMCRELFMQRIHKTCQANCVTFRGVCAQRPRQVASSVECVRRYGNRCAAPTSRKADLLSPAVRYSWARFLTMPSATFADQGPASSRVEPSWRVRRPSGGEQHRQDRSVGMADGVDADATHHRGDRAVGFCLHPGGAVLQPQIRQPRQQHASRRRAVAFG